MKMKKLETLLPALIAVTWAPVPLPLVHADDSVVTSTQSPKDVFTPRGFDDNDNVQVVLEGNFRSFCYHTAPAQVQVEGDRIYVENPIYSMGHCVPTFMYVPYQRVVDVGVLPVGEYEIWVSDGAGGYQKRASIPVAESKPSRYTPDDELYAPVTEVSFHPAQNGEDPSITVRGSLNNTCLSLGSVAVHNHGGNVLEVLPRANLASGPNCAPAVVPFSKTVSLPNFPAQGDVLIHTRSMGGQAVNRVVTVLDRGGL